MISSEIFASRTTSSWSGSLLIVLLQGLNIQNQLKMFEKSLQATNPWCSARPKTNGALSPMQFWNAFVWMIKCICLNLCMFLSKLGNIAKQKTTVLRIHDICHFVDTSTIFSSKFDNTPNRGFLHQKNIKNTLILDILTPGWNWHLHRMWCRWQISGMVLPPPPQSYAMQCRKKIYWVCVLKCIFIFVIFCFYIRNILFSYL